MSGRLADRKAFMLALYDCDGSGFGGGRVGMAAPKPGLPIPQKCGRKRITRDVLANCGSCSHVADQIRPGM